jgi:hypothetical protein
MPLFPHLFHWYRDPSSLQSRIPEYSCTGATLENAAVFQKMGISGCGSQKMWNRHHETSCGLFPFTRDRIKNNVQQTSNHERRPNPTPYQPLHLHSLASHHRRNAAPPPFCQCCGSRLLLLASLRARHSDIAGIKKNVHANLIAPFSMTIKDGTTHPPPCISPWIIDDAAEFLLQKIWWDQ